MIPSTTKIESPPLTPKKTDQAIHSNQAIRECAMKVLGSGYSRANGTPLLGKVVANISEQDLRILEDFSVFTHTKVANEQQLSTIMNQLFKGSFSNGFCSPSGKMEEVANSQTNTSIYAVHGMNHVRCECTTTNPRIEKEATRSADSYVRAASFYCGYQILIRISTGSQANINQTNLSCTVSAPSVSLNHTSSDLFKQLREEKIEHVEIRGFGGYHPPMSTSGLDIASIEKTINETEAHFKQELPNIVNRYHDIDIQSDIVSYPDLDRDCFNEDKQIQINPPSQTPPSINATTPLKQEKEDLDTILNDLVSDIRNSCQNTYVKKMGFSLSTIFQKIHEIFPQALSSKPRGKTPFTLVIGESGAGKSLHIGYLLSAKIQQRTDQKLDYACPDPKLPLVGHEPTSQTQGCQVYERYMDCAGFLDTSGTEVDICNIMAISMMNQKYAPNRVIIIIPYTRLTGAKPSIVEFIKSLKKIINLNDDKVFASILFIFSDSLGLSAKAPPEDHLKRAIKGITQTRDKLLPPHLKSWANQHWSSQKEAFVRDFNKIEPAQVQKMYECNEEKEILEQLIKQKNFLVSNLLSEETRKMVHQWENSSEIEDFPATSLRLEEMVEDASLCFRSVLAATATYFNDLKRNQRLFEETIKQTEWDIQSTKASIESMQQEVSKPQGSDPKILEQQNIKFTTTLSEKEKKLNDLEKILREKEIEIAALNTDHPQILKTLSPTEQIQARNGWSWIGNFLAKSYEFKGTTAPVPFLKYVTVGDETGKFYSEKLDEKTNQFTIRYYPNYDCETPYGFVKLYVKQKDHPETQNKIKTLHDQIHHSKTGLRDQIASLKTEIEGLQFKVKETDMQKRLLSAQKDLKNYTTKKEEYIEEKNRLIEKLERYEEFRQLIGKVIRGLREMDDARGETGCEEETFKEFCLLFPT